MESCCCFSKLVLCCLAALLMFFVTSLSGAQGLPQSPYSAPSMMRGGLDLAPTNPWGMPGSQGGSAQGSNSIYLNSGMFSDILPLVPNLEIGYLYNFGKNTRTGRLSVDYVLPVGVAQDSAAFGEAHGEFTNFWKTILGLFGSRHRITGLSSFNERSDLSIGGGYRKIFSDNLMLGVNGFYDTSELGGRWYGSAGIGFEMAALGPGYDLIDLNFNYYGSLFQGRNSIVNAFRNGPGNFDLEIGYSHELGEGGPDLRLKLTGYQFDIGTRVYGWNAGAEVKSRNGMFSVRAETGQDRINGTYHTVGGFVNVGLQLDRLFNGESPFVMPEPIFKSPRNLRRLLTKKVERAFFQPTSVVVGRGRLCSVLIVATAPLNNGEAPLARYFGGGTWTALFTADSFHPYFNPWARLSTSIDSARIDPSCGGTIDVSVQADNGSFPLPDVEVRVRLHDLASGVTSSYFQNGVRQVLPAPGVPGRWVIFLSPGQLAALAIPGRTWDTISVEVRHQGGVISRGIRVNANRVIVTLGSR